MYGGVSGILWLEFLINHRRNKENMKTKHVVIGAMILPVLLGGGMEIGQMCLTSYRSGSWLDFIANTAGVLVASLIGWYMLRPLIIKTK